MIKKLFFVLLVVGVSINVTAQKPSSGYESRYIAAKNLLEQGKFGLAMQSFKTLLASNEKNKLVPYTLFYLGNSAYKDGNISYAKEVFLQLTVNHPNWSKIDAAFLWLSHIGFEQSGPFKGMLYADKIVLQPYVAKSNAFVKTQLENTELDVLEKLNLEYPDNKMVAEAYAHALSNLPNRAKISSKLDSLINKFQFDRSLFNSIPISELKDHYSIGILLPLFINRIEATGKYLNKSLAIDIYEGAKMAVYDTDSTLFSLHVFDTKKDSAKLSGFINNGGLKNMDAILGPIYPKPVAKMMSVASKEKINFLNPTSSNPAISNSSSYAFLSRADARQLAIKAAQYMKSQKLNRNLFIYYGTTEVDSIAAYEYKKTMEADSFKVVSFLKIDSENRRKVYDILTASKTITDYSKLRRMTREQIQRAFQLPKKDSLLIQPDSLGHIFIASSDPTVPTETMSAIISRGDSIKIMGIGNWFESNDAGFGIMEGLGVTLVISAVDDVATEEYRELKNRYIHKYSKQPSKYFFRGYFGMKAIAESLKEYGTYFQNEYRKNGNFNSLFDFEKSNSNGAIKIIKMVDKHIQEIESDNTDTLLY